MGLRAAALVLGVAAGVGRAQDPAPPPTKPLFYSGLTYGSEGQFNPFSAWVAYAFDTLQVNASFDDADLRDRWGKVRTNLTHVNAAVKDQGGWSAFVNRQVLPYRFTEKDWIPNYGLHLLGGGMIYRKNAEWLEAHGQPWPRLTAAILNMSAEIFQEVVEKKTTKPDDEVADVLLFEPAGILLYSYEPFARWSADTLQLVDWPYQSMFDPNRPRPGGGHGGLVNVGQNFAARPELFGSRNHRAFVHFGMTTLAGLSHRINAKDSVSWGVGAAITHAKDPTTTRYAGGLFWDRDDSLMASLILNGTEDLKVRLNLYPGIVGPGSWWSPGLYVGVGRNREVAAGLTLRVLPVGIGRSSRKDP